MKTKPSTQIIQAILITLAMVGGMLLLPGNKLHGSPECTPGGGTVPVSLGQIPQSMQPGSCLR